MHVLIVVAGNLLVFLTSVCVLSRRTPIIHSQYYSVDLQQMQVIDVYFAEASTVQKKYCDTHASIGCSSLHTFVDSIVWTK